MRMNQVALHRILLPGKLIVEATQWIIQGVD